MHVDIIAQRKVLIAYNDLQTLPLKGLFGVCIFCFFFSPDLATFAQNILVQPIYS